jgi:hypothetical protein
MTKKQVREMYNKLMFDDINTKVYMKDGVLKIVDGETNNEYDEMTKSEYIDLFNAVFEGVAMVAFDGKKYRAIVDGFYIKSKSFASIFEKALAILHTSGSLKMVHNRNKAVEDMFNCDSLEISF